MRTLLFCLIVFAVSFPVQARANHLVVPDQFATIQAAVGASGDGDTVYVRDGDYPEALTLAKPLVLMALEITSYYGGPRLGKPRARSLTWSASTSPRIVHGFRFSGAVTFTGGGDIGIEGCWVGGGISANVPTYGHIWNNTVFGNVDANSGGIVDIAMNTVIGGTISYNPPGDSPIHDNVVVGPAAVGIAAWSDAQTNRNYVRGCTTGIQESGEFTGAADNVVEDCSGSGILTLNEYDSYGQSRNVVRRCGRGLELNVYRAYKPGDVTDNLVENSAAEGILVRGGLGGTLRGNTVRSSGGRGIDAGNSCFVVRDNRVFVAGAEGIVASTQYDFAVRVTGNVVGHAVGDGVSASGPLTVRGNTSYLNGGAGFATTGTAADSVDHDIAFMNGGVGLARAGAAPVMGCNDWYGNTGGTTSGVAMAPTDDVLDPLFCNSANDDVGLQAASPLAAYPGCGLIGALGVTCSATAVPPPAALGVFGLEVAGSPARGATRFVWNAPGGGQLSIYDVTGQRRWTSELANDRGEVVWQGVGPGVYFARLTAGGRTVTKRVVLVQ